MKKTIAVLLSLLMVTAVILTAAVRQIRDREKAKTADLPYGKKRDDVH